MNKTLKKVGFVFLFIVTSTILAIILNGIYFYATQNFARSTVNYRSFSEGQSAKEEQIERCFALCGKGSVKPEGELCLDNECFIGCVGGAEIYP